MKRAHKSPRVHRAQAPTRVKTGRPIEKRGHGDQPPLAFRAPALAPRLAQTRLSTESISFRLRLSSILAPTTALHVFRKSRNRGNPRREERRRIGREGLATAASVHRPTCIGPSASARKHRPVSIGCMHRPYASAHMHRPACRSPEGTRCGLCARGTARTQGQALAPENNARTQADIGCPSGPDFDACAQSKLV
jgi:hypothetical protein